MPGPAVQCHAQAVRNFTRACAQPTPNRPELMNVNEVDFLTKMLLDEVLELQATVRPPAQAKQVMNQMLMQAKDCQQIITNDKNQLMGEQADAMVDMWYYSLNAAAKKGMNLSKVFNLVHSANMAKINPATGKCLKRADGKIIKPNGWKAPDITQEMMRQTQLGSF